MPSPSTLRRLAAIVRDELEALLASSRRGNHSHDRRRRHICWRDDLANGCFAGAYALYRLLLARGIDAVIFVASPDPRRFHLRYHAWVEVNGCVVDVTATQLGLSRVYVSRRAPIHRDMFVRSRGREAVTFVRSVAETPCCVVDRAYDRVRKAA